ncbi:MAG: methylated-DNA--[protein]-cysteine S-methyltransferase [Acidobacteriota bacterium]
MQRKTKEKILYAELRGTPVGNLFIGASGKRLAFLSFGDRSEKALVEKESKRFGESPTFIKAGILNLKDLRKGSLQPGELKGAERHLKILKGTAYQLADYFYGRLKRFQIKKDATMLTDFEKGVLKELERIPCGKTSSYQEIARRVGNPRASRAVGNAVGKNPFAIIVPCHRIIRKDGSLGGFGAPVSIKKLLLSFEKNLSSINKP